MKQVIDTVWWSILPPADNHWGSDATMMNNFEEVLWNSSITKTMSNGEFSINYLQNTQQ